MEFADALRVVQRRGEAMQQASDARPSGMVSVLGLDQDKLSALCDACREPGEVLQIANLLCPGNIAVSGDRAACERLAARASEAGAMRAIPLSVAGAFHTAIMDGASHQLASVLADVVIKKPRIPVVSNVDGRPHSDPDEIRKLLVQQVVSPVFWEDSMRYLLNEQIGQFYEIGPGRVLAGLLKRVNRKIPCEHVVC